MCLVRRPLTALAPHAVHDVGPDVARDGIAHVWPAYRDGLGSLLEDNPLKVWLAAPLLPTHVVIGDGDTTVTPEDLLPLLTSGAAPQRLAGTHLLPLEQPARVAEAITAPA